jgi:uncharacterized membrane protein
LEVVTSNADIRIIKTKLKSKIIQHRVNFVFCDFPLERHSMQQHFNTFFKIFHQQLPVAKFLTE